ncbi:hypothetical protein Tco_0591707 [Tanacetum coccineum]
MTRRPRLGDQSALKLKNPIPSLLSDVYPVAKATLAFLNLNKKKLITFPTLLAQHIYVLTDMELCVGSDVVINLWHDSTDADKAEETEKEDEVVFSGGKMQGFEVIVPDEVMRFQHIYVLTDMELCVGNDVVINLWHDSTDADKAEETEKEDEVVFSGVGAGGGRMLKLERKTSNKAEERPLVKISSY